MSTDTPATQTWPALLARLIAGTDLDAVDTAWVMDQVLAGDATPVQLAGFLVALRSKGETAAEITGLAEAMLRHTRRVAVEGRAVDVVGTGGDHAHTVNISSMSAVVAAAAGVPVVKHGNRAATSACGAADVLEELGVAIDLPPEAVAACVAQVGIGFCFAAVYHPSMRHTSVPRRELGIPTAMNVLGPLTNPAQPNAGLVGCADARLAPVLAEVFASRGASVLVVRGDDGLDELTTTGTSTVWAVGGGEVRVETLDPATLGLPVATRADLRGGDPRGQRRGVSCRAGGGVGAGARRGAAQRGGCTGGRGRDRGRDRPWLPRRRVPCCAQAGRRRDRRGRRAGGLGPLGRAVELARRCSPTMIAGSVRKPALHRNGDHGAVGRWGRWGGSGEADGERGVGVDLRVGAERDVGVGVLHPGDLREVPGDDVGELLVGADPHDRDEIDIACAGVDLRHAVEVGDGLRGLGDAVGGAVHQDDRGDHSGHPSVPSRDFATGLGGPAARRRVAGPAEYARYEARTGASPPDAWIHRYRPRTSDSGHWAVS